MTSSGSAVSANAVKPRRSQNTTVTSRRCASSSFSCPPDKTSSATCGDRKRRRRCMRSISPTWASTLAVELAGSMSRELGRLRVDLVLQLLDPQHGADAREQRGLVDRLGQIVVGAGIEPGDDVLCRRSWR